MRRSNTCPGIGIPADEIPEFRYESGKAGYDRVFILFGNKI